MGIAGIVEPKDVDALIEACQDVLESMKNNITEYELEKAKNTILSQIAGHNDLCFGKAQSNALSLLLRGRLTDWDEVLEFIKGVTVEDIYQFANDYTTPNYCLSVTSPR
jgi:predicted Zn-dependent peptidase